MKIWSGVSRLLWREEYAHAVEPEPLTPARASGVPASLRQAVRFTLTGLAATLLTAQIVGIRLAGPVDANQTYSSCPDTCDAQFAIDVQKCRSCENGFVMARRGFSLFQTCVSTAEQKRDLCKARCCDSDH